MYVHRVQIWGCAGVTIRYRYARDNIVHYVCSVHICMFFFNHFNVFPMYNYVQLCTH